MNDGFDHFARNQAFVATDGGGDDDIIHTAYTSHIVEVHHQGILSNPFPHVPQLGGKRKEAEGTYYAVARGRKVGVFRPQDWGDAHASVNKFSGCCYKKFDDLKEALEFVAARRENRMETMDEAKAGGHDQRTWDVAARGGTL